MPPKAYIVCGRPGAGKTAYGRQLAQRQQATLLDIDLATERLVQLALELSGQDADDRDSPYFKKHFREPIYEQLFDIAKVNLAWQNVVITGPFTKEIKNPDWPHQLSIRLGAVVEVHYVACPPAIREARIRKRNNPRDGAKLNDWEKYLQYYEAELPPACAHILVDNSAEKEFLAWF